MGIYTNPAFAATHSAMPPNDIPKKVLDVCKYDTYYDFHVCKLHTLPADRLPDSNGSSVKYLRFAAVLNLCKLLQLYKER